MLQRFSFRQLLVIAFLLIAALLGAASLRVLFALEDLTLQSRDNAVRALDLSGAAQSLRERTVSMERSSRQSVVLNDRVLRQRFRDEARDAIDARTDLPEDHRQALLEQIDRLEELDKLIDTDETWLKSKIAPYIKTRAAARNFLRERMQRPPLPVWLTEPIGMEDDSPAPRPRVGMFGGSKRR